ncbi:MAG: prepilin-type N-terminal cleavage/methylation domain-containing protein [Candidatus Eremiobacteraeota bacterium]|nr:prepilin-type N-terminal cleavage/methylation domain-containing protein [Candidatus Eremiobacteraeota bacterium]MCW5868772.1 prepilin-type N-terminal cleavage/methylation domain-containing protein [Candidatus Eremiobacteraeota bacterium]
MKRLRAGFSLLEALVSLALMSILLGVVASLMRDSSILMRQADNDQLAGIQSALDSVARDLRAAYKINQCDSAAVEVVKIDPADTARLPNPLPTPAGTFKLHGAAASITVRYYVDADTLRCKTTFSDGSEDDLEATAGISGFDAQKIHPGLVELSASSQDTSSNPVKVVSLRTLVVLHLPPQVMP